MAILALVAVILGVTACGKQDEVPSTTESKHHELVTEATEQLKSHWKEYCEDPDSNMDGYFEIKNVRVITIKDNEIEQFDLKDAAYIIEYELYTDYMGSAPYYENCGIDNNVVVYKNGTMEVSSNVIQMYRGQTYQTDFSDFMEAIDDCHDQYNCIENLSE